MPCTNWIQIPSRMRRLSAEPEESLVDIGAAHRDSNLDETSG